MFERKVARNDLVYSFKNSENIEKKLAPAAMGPLLSSILEELNLNKKSKQDCSKKRYFKSEMDIGTKKDVKEKKTKNNIKFAQSGTQTKNNNSSINKNLKLRILTDTSKKIEKKAESQVSNRTQDAETLLLLRHISSFYLVKKFISRLQGQANLRRTKFLREKHFNLIKDLSVYPKSSQAEKDVNLNLYKMMLKMIGCLNYLMKLTSWGSFGKYLQTFDPTKTFRTIWDILMIFFIMVNFIIIPINLSFDMNLWEIWAESSSHLPVSIIRIVSIYFFFVDIAVNFNTAIYRRGNLETSRKVIAKKYIRKQFFRDLLSSGFLLVEYYGFDQGFRWFGVLFVTRIFTISEIINRMEQLLLYDNRLHNKILLINLIIRMLVLSHIFACSWHYLATIQNSEDTWLQLANIQNEDWLTKYIYSFYYVAVTMNTVGYGDIHPNNKLEVIYTIFFVYVACGIFAFNLNSVGIIVQDINKRDNTFRQNLILINGYMKKKQISPDLRVKIRKYLEYIWLEENTQTNKDENKIISRLSESLKEELLLEANSKILKNIPYFSYNFSEDLLPKAVNIIEEVRFTPEDIIFMKDDIDDNSLYIVRKGEVEVFVITPRKNQPMTSLKKLRNGELFGEFSFFTGFGRKACARSTEFTSLYKIKQKDFLKLMADHPDDFEKFCMIRDKIILYKSMEDLEINCYSCNSNGHYATECPLLHYCPSREVIIHRHTFNKPLERKKIKRRSNSVKFSALRNKPVVNVELELFRLDNNIEIDIQEGDESTCSEKNYTHVEETKVDEHLSEGTKPNHVNNKEDNLADDKTQDKERRDYELSKQTKNIVSPPNSKYLIQKKSVTDFQNEFKELSKEERKNSEGTINTERSELNISRFSLNTKFSNHPKSISDHIGQASQIHKFDSREMRKERKEEIQTSNPSKMYSPSNSKCATRTSYSLTMKKKLAFIEALRKIFEENPGKDTGALYGVLSTMTKCLSLLVNAPCIKDILNENPHLNLEQDEKDDLEKVELLKQFDRMKRFNFYFSNNNIENVINLKPSSPFKTITRVSLYFSKRNQYKKEESFSNPLQKKRFFRRETDLSKKFSSPIKRNKTLKAPRIQKLKRFYDFIFGNK